MCRSFLACGEASLHYWGWKLFLVVEKSVYLVVAFLRLLLAAIDLNGSHHENIP